MREQARVSVPEKTPLILGVLEAQAITPNPSVAFFVADNTLPLSPESCLECSIRLAAQHEPEQDKGETEEMRMGALRLLNAIKGYCDGQKAQQATDER